MKTNLSIVFTVSMVLLFTVSMAQPTLTATGINASIGDAAMYYTGTHLSEGPSGANQTWDYTALAGSQGESYTWVSPSSTTHGSSFPTATIAASTGSGTLIRYYANSATLQQNVGTFASNVVAPLTDPEDYLRFPFTMGNSFVDAWEGQFTNAGYTFYRSGTTTVTADAYGTMITPAGTFTNVLRVHLVQDYQDSSFIGVPFISTYYNDQYIWYQDGVPFPIASTFILTTPAGPTSSSSYSSSGPVSITSSADRSASVIMYPNPASDHLSLDVTLTQGTDVNVLIFNAVGQQVHALQAGKCGIGLNQFEIAVDGMSEGVYFAKVMVEGGDVVTRQFVVAR